MKRLLFFGIVAFFAGVSAAGIKYVAVVETDIDAQSGASATLTSADARLVTAELRREAVQNLPRDRYSIMTSETVQSMGGAVLEECSEENCVIVLGSKIGADYIVRGTISKFQTKFTLTVEMYDTDNGTLVASSSPVRSEKVEDLLERGGAACAEMYRVFASAQRPAASAPIPISEPAPKREPTPVSAKPKPIGHEKKAKPAPVSVSAKPELAPAPAKPLAPGIVNVPGDAQTISEAIYLARRNGYNTVQVAPGVYRERIVTIPGVALVSTLPFGAVIDGGGRGIVVTMAANSSVTGFEVRNGTIGIFSNDSGNEIRRCRVVNNWMTGVMVKRFLPQIEDNIIAFNGASGIQAWDIGETSTTVNHNTIAYNGNHGIAVGGSSKFVIEHNVVAFNEWYGLKIAREPENIYVSMNNFYGNLSQPNRIFPKSNYAINPVFLSPLKDPNLRQDKEKCCKEKDANGEDLGARLNY